MNGQVIDLEKLISQNELVPAIGNMKVNARGDELGAGGKIIRKREDIVAAYYEDNPAAQPAVIKKATPAPAPAPASSAPDFFEPEIKPAPTSTIKKSQSEE
jgi:hypothetical protein